MPGPQSASWQRCGALLLLQPQWGTWSIFPRTCVLGWTSSTTESCARSNQRIRFCPILEIQIPAPTRIQPWQRRLGGRWMSLNNKLKAEDRFMLSLKYLPCLYGWTVLQAPTSLQRRWFQHSLGSRDDQLWELLRVMLQPDELEAFEDGDIQKLVANRYFSPGTFRHASRAGLKSALPDAPGLVDILMVKVAVPIAGGPRQKADLSFSPPPPDVASEKECSGWPARLTATQSTASQESSDLVTRVELERSRFKELDTSPAYSPVLLDRASIKSYGTPAAPAEADKPSFKGYDFPPAPELLDRTSLNPSAARPAAPLVPDKSTFRRDSDSSPGPATGDEPPSKELANWPARDRSLQKSAAGQADEDSDEDWSRIWFERYIKRPLLLYRRLIALVFKVKLLGPRVFKSIIDIWRSLRGPRQP